MARGSLERRLSALEQLETQQQAADDGYAPEAEIVCWEMGRQAWQTIMEVLEGTAHAQP